jgi:hypothetical protein
MTENAKIVVSKIPDKYCIVAEILSTGGATRTLLARDFKDPMKILVKISRHEK